MGWDGCLWVGMGWDRGCEVGMGGIGAGMAAFGWGWAGQSDTVRAAPVPEEVAGARPHCCHTAPACVKVRSGLLQASEK